MPRFSRHSISRIARPAKMKVPSYSRAVENKSDKGKYAAGTPFPLPFVCTEALSSERKFNDAMNI